MTKPKLTTMRKRDAEDHYQTAVTALSEELQKKLVTNKVPSSHLRECARALSAMREFFIPESAKLEKKED
tara:strand:- start:27448 stop:27657 length:210 start_codon:yes stop_codon:yes gene_type:complete